MADGDNVIIGQGNWASSQTLLSVLPGSNGVIGFQVDSNSDWSGAIRGAGYAYGVWGESSASGSSGVVGTALANNSFGVEGMASDDSSVAVYGKNTLSGKGRTSGVGVHGESDAGPGVQGISNNILAESIGVIGGGGNNGVYGWTWSGTGVVGQTFNDDPNSYGVFSWGNLGYVGQLNHFVPYSANKYQTLHLVGSPEAWLEDFGRAKLSKGRAKVAIPKDLTSLIHTKAYHVFITPEGACNGLYVWNLNGQGFEVRELGGGTSNVSFSFRIVARRKGAGPRLAKVTLRVPDAKRLTVKPPQKTVSRLKSLLERQAGGDGHPVKGNGRKHNAPRLPA